MEAVIDMALAKRSAVLHIYHSASREVYEQYLWRVCDHVVHAYVTVLLDGRKITDSDLKFINEYLSSLAFGLFSRWLKNDMTEDTRNILARLSEITKEMIEEMISRCEENGSGRPEIFAKK